MGVTEESVGSSLTPGGDADAVKQLLALYKQRVDAALQTTAEELNGPGRLQEACSYALLNGGKRFRPAIVLMVARAIGCATGREVGVMDAAVAVECMHAASLVADDLPCMDDDDERRDKPSVHVTYGEASAVLVSYALIAEGYRLLTSASERLVLDGHATAAQAAIVCQEAVRVVSACTGIQGATGGQFVDLFPPDLSESTLREIFDRKTVTLFEISFVLGWLYGGGDSEKLDLVKSLAYHFGMAFQIADDFGDVAQDAEHEHAVNLAGALGMDKALQVFHKELAAYYAVLSELEVEQDELHALGVLLQARAYRYIHNA